MYSSHIHPPGILPVSPFQFHVPTPPIPLSVIAHQIQLVLSTYTWVWSPWSLVSPPGATPVRKTDSQSTTASSCQYQLSQGWGLSLPSVSMPESRWCFILLRWAQQLRTGECRGTVIVRWPCFLPLPDLWLLNIFCSIFWDVPWTVRGGIWYRCLIYGWAHTNTLYFDQLWVSASTDTIFF